MVRVTSTSLHRDRDLAYLIQRDDWARNQSPNPDVKVYIGAPGSATAAGQGYVDITMLQNYALDAQQNYSTFGGVMLWDASDAYGTDASCCCCYVFYSRIPQRTIATTKRSRDGCKLMRERWQEVRSATAKAAGARETRLLSPARKVPYFIKNRVFHEAT